MMYVIEGVDRVGKSTFARKLSEKFGYTYQHYSKPDIHPTKYFNKGFAECIQNGGVVCDRFVLGEKIYAKVKKTESQWTQEEYENALKLMSGYRAVLIVCWEYKETLKKRFVEEKEEFITYEEGIKVQRMFLKEAKRIAKAYPGILVMTYKPSTNMLRILSERV